MTTGNQPSHVLVGRYRLDAPLAQRSDGWYCRAHDLVLDEAVMVKMFEATVDDPVARVFAAQAKSLVGLRHPHLVTLADGGVADGHPFLVLEPVDGFDLLDGATGKPLSAFETAALGAGLADALAHLHEQGIVHGDLTEASVVTGAGGQHRLVGFGFGDTHDSTAPDDVRALGLVLLRCLNGPGADRPTGATPQPLARVLTAMTRRSPERRLSALECVQWLSRAADALESGRRPATVASVRRTWVAGVAAAGVLVTGAMVTLAPSRTSEQSLPPLAEPVPTVSSQLPTTDTTVPTTLAAPASYPTSQPSHTSTPPRTSTTSAGPTTTSPTSTTETQPTTAIGDPTSVDPTTTEELPPVSIKKPPVVISPGFLKKLFWMQQDGWSWF